MSLWCTRLKILCVPLPPSPCYVEQERTATVDLATDTSLMVDISDALSEQDKVKFTVHTKVLRLIATVTAVILQGFILQGFMLQGFILQGLLCYRLHSKLSRKLISQLSESTRSLCGSMTDL